MSSLNKIWVSSSRVLGKSMLNVNVISVPSRKLESSNSTEKEAQFISEEVVLEEEIENDIDKIRDKSRMRQEHHNILFNKKPYSEPKIETHLTVKYNRKMFGRYGSDSGVNPGIMWPTKEDLKDRKEYERVAYPLTIQEMVKAATEQVKSRELEIQKAHERVVVNLTKLEKWKQDLQDKIAKKEAAALATKEKKEKLIEEVRRHFGFFIDPKDERFKEALALKEKEQKKKERLAKIEERERKAIAKLMEKHQTDTEQS